MSPASCARPTFRGGTPGPLVVGATGVALFLLIWQWAAIRIDSENALPTLPAIAGALADLAQTAEFWTGIGMTLLLAMLGWLIAGVIGVAIGMLVGMSPVAHAATRVALEFLRPIPAIVILPLVMTVLGPTAEMGVFLAVFGVALPIAAQTTAGVESVDPIMRNTARSFGLSPAEILIRVVLPGASPYIGTAMRVAAPVTLIMIVVAGLLGGAPGIGSALSVAQANGQIVVIFAYVLVLGFLGLLVQWATVRGERVLLHWHSAYRKES